MDRQHVHAVIQVFAELASGHRFGGLLVGCREDAHVHLDRLGAAGEETGAHHHGPVESVIYVVSGRARMKWGDRLEFVAEAGPGDFIYVPPYVPHQEINANDDEPLSCVLVRSGQEPVVVNLDLPAVEPNPENVHWVDNIHPAPAR
mgnify:CR=1 FL=1